MSRRVAPCNEWRNNQLFFGGNCFAQRVARETEPTARTPAPPTCRSNTWRWRARDAHHIADAQTARRNFVAIFVAQTVVRGPSPRRRPPACAACHHGRCCSPPSSRCAPLLWRSCGLPRRVPRAAAGHGTVRTRPTSACGSAAPTSHQQRERGRRERDARACAVEETTRAKA